jgi:prophage regulatory protein
MNAPKRFLRLPAVIELIGLKRTVIYDRIKAGTFPAPIQIGPRAVAWDAEELAQWQQNLTRGVKKAAI